ncbi:Integrase core domain protein [Rubripirellula tenax]|uniref:Integrase core domain protein n=1 Tax=Rubripirellula tenax TaxID=2528015 RepID=A0A5C6EZ37_9BACT|nr:IS21 family transposase [Rubripirellula tenax]TWU54332.1 Integrase core domain protein [Rubripirellula tenax]
MADQLAMDKSLAISNLRDAGYSQRRIAKTLGVSRGAVRRHLAGESSNRTIAPTAPIALAPTGSADSNSTTAPTGSDQSQATDSAAVGNSQCEPFRDIVIQKCQAGLSARRIHQDLVADHGADVSYWSVNRFVQALGRTTELPFRRMEVRPGEELQVDFGTGAKIRNPDGTYRRTHVFRAVLSHSRKGYSEAVFRQDTESFIRALENCFWAIGGVPQRVVFDNAKCAVKTPDWHDPELNPKLVDFCKHYGCAFLPTRVRTPRHKGKVERGVDYVQENALRGREFETLAAQNDHLHHWESRVADTRIHGTTRKQVLACFIDVEKPSLANLPSTRFEFYHEAKRKVSRGGHISINRSFYSVPPEYLGRDIWVRHDSHLVRIFDENLRHIATHTIIEPGRFQTDAGHIASQKISPIERGIAHLHNKMRLIGPSANQWADAVVAGRGVEAARVLQGVLAMSRMHSGDAIDAACGIAVRSGAINCRIIRTLLRRQPETTQTTMEFMEDHPIIRPIVEYAKFIHTKVQEGIYQSIRSSPPC